MIKFEHNNLILDSSHSKEDQEAINAFIKYKAQEAYNQGWEIGYDAALIELQEEPSL
jgi:flagellar biosynthesis/type III secretory pathway protein FliH